MTKTKSTRIIALATFLVMLLSIFNFLPILNVWAADPVTVTDQNGIRTQITAGATNIIYNPAQFVLITSDITIPAGVTLTISAGGNSLTNNATFINNGTLINNNNNFQNYQSFTNNGTLTNNGNIYNTGSSAVLTNNASGTITNTKTLDNSATFNNYGTFTNNATFNNSGTFNDSGTTQDDKKIELIKSGVTSRYATIQQALNEINVSGCTIHLTENTEIIGNISTKFPSIPFTISGDNASGTSYYLHIHDGCFAPPDELTLKNVTLKHTGTGSFLTRNVKLFVDGTVSMKYMNASEVTLSANSTLNSQELNTGKLVMNNASTVGIDNSGYLKITGNLSSIGTGKKYIKLPAPTDHSGKIYSMDLSGSTTYSGTLGSIEIQPITSVSHNNDNKLIYLDTNSGITSGVFTHSSLTQMLVQKTLDSQLYLTLKDAPYPTTITVEPISDITYGDGVTIKATLKKASDGTPLNNAQLRITHSVMGFSPQNTNSSGQIEIPLSILTASPGTCTFNVSYSDTTGVYASSSNSVSFDISPKSLSITGLSIADKAYDTTTDASISGTPQLNGTISGDNVYLVNGIPSFVSSDSSANPISVSFTNFTLSGTAASNYTLTQPTGITARINKADNTLVISCDNITFGGTPTPQVTTNTSGGNVTYEYKLKDANDDTYTATVPTNAGNYTVRGTSASTENYNIATATDDFSISSHNNTLVISCDNITFGETPTPQVTTNTSGGNVTYEYKLKDANDDTYTATVPTNAGDYTVRGTSASTAAYNLATTTADFTIRKATLLASTNNASIVAGDNLPAFVVTVTGFVSGEDESLTGFVKPTVIHSVTDTAIVGEYTLTISGGNPTSNYEFSYQTGSKITIDTRINAENPMFNPDLSGLTTYKKGDAPTQLKVLANVSDGGTILYQWYKNITNSTTGGTAISDATSSGYTPPTDIVGTVYYYVIATNTNISVNGTKTAAAISGIKTITVNASSDNNNNSSNNSTPSTPTTTTPQTIPQIIKGNLADTSPKQVEIAKTSNNEFKEIKAEIILLKTTDKQKEALKNMTEAEIQAEIKKATDAISTVNTTGITEKAKEKIAEVKKTLPADAKIMPINFTAHATFAFPVEVSIPVDKTTYPAGTYYLYYYNEETGKVEDCGTVIVDANGVATFTISHCSDYFISSETIDLSDANAVATVVDITTSENPKTGGNNTIGTFSIIALMSATTLTVVSKKRKFKLVK